MNPVSKGNVATIRIVGKRHDETVLVDAEVGQRDDIAEDQFAVVVELEEMSAEDERILTPPPSVETLVYGDGVGDAEMSAEIKRKEHTVKSLNNKAHLFINGNNLKLYGDEKFLESHKSNSSSNFQFRKSGSWHVRYVKSSPHE